MENDDYKKTWEELGQLQIKLVEKLGTCKHELNDSFIYKNPYEKPQGVCSALLHVIDLYTWRVTLGFPSWESDNPSIYMVHCPSKKGTVWELKKLPEIE